ncbi:unnamed protein product [Closterium sp. NIES-64]|nr:unnamed protein product [Closterium sp. NIES-64]
MVSLSVHVPIPTHLVLTPSPSTLFTPSPSTLFTPFPPTLFNAQVEECISSKTTGPLKDASMDAPDDAVLHLAQLALSCTVECPTSQPSMSGIANELQGIRHEVVGKEVLSAAVKVDEEAEEIGIGMSFWGNLNTDLEAIETMDEEESNGEQSAKSIQ